MEIIKKAIVGLFFVLNAAALMAHDITDIQPRSFKRSTETTVRVYVKNDTGYSTQYEMRMSSLPAGWSIDQANKTFWVNPNTTGYVEFKVTPPSTGGTGSLGGLLRVNDWGTWKDVVTRTVSVTANEADMAAISFTFSPARLPQGGRPTSVQFTYKNFGINNMSGNKVRHAIYITQKTTFDASAILIGYIDASDFNVSGSSETLTLSSAVDLANYIIPSAASGTYYVYYKITHQSPSTLTDPDPADNTALSGGGMLTVGPAGTIQFKASSYSANENAGTVRVYASRTGGAFGVVTAQYTTANGTALSGSDYTAKSGTLSWNDNDSIDKYFDITILDDTIYEPNENFDVSFTSLKGADFGDPTLTKINVADNDPRGSIAIYGYDPGGGEEIGFVRVIVRRSNGNSGAARVDYSTANGTAIAPGDYTAKSGTLYWNDKESGDKSVDIPVVKDTLVEGTETVYFSISNVNGADQGDPTLIPVNILDSNGRIRLGSSTYSVTEGDTLRVAVERIEGARTYTEMNVITLNGSAQYANDYNQVGTQGYVSWNAGEVGTKYVDFNILNDSSVEGNETFTVALQENSYTVAKMTAPTSAVVTISDPGLPGTLQFSSSSYSVNENGGNVTITVTRTGGSFGAASVNYATANGTAGSGSDYTITSGTLNWADGNSSSQTFSVPILNDSTYEGNETFTVTLSGASGAALGSPASATVTINEDDPAPSAGTIQLSAATYSANENGGNLTITVTRTGGSSGAASVSYATANGSATAGSDYTTASGSLNWTDGSSASKTFSVPILNDSTYEDNETFTVSLSNVAGATLGNPASATVTIISDDPAPSSGVIQFNAGGLLVSEGSSEALITVVRTGGSVGAASVNYATANGSASAGSDFTTTSGTLNWANGNSVSQTIRVPLLGDSIYEGDENFSVSLSGVSGASLGSPATVNVIIQENDSPSPSGTIQLSATAYSINENGGSVILTVNRSGGSGGEARVNFATANGTASAGSDYTATSGTLIWPNGNSQPKTFSIPILNNPAHEGNETFTVTLSGVTGASLGSPSVATVTIREISLSDYDGNGVSDLAVFDKAGGYWYIQALSGATIAWKHSWGWNAAYPVPGDYDGDGKWDLALFDGMTAEWNIKTLTGFVIAYTNQWGWNTVKPVSGDYDGDGRWDQAIFDAVGGYWYIKNLAGNIITWKQQWGWSTAKPVPGDYDGDGKFDLAMFDTAGGYWYIKSLSGNVITWKNQWGWSTAKPVPGDYDGDGIWDQAVFDTAGGYWYIRSLSGNVITWKNQWGWSTAKPVSGDYNGDGKFDLSVYDTATGKWYIKGIDGAVIAWGVSWGWPGAIAPALGD